MKVIIPSLSVIVPAYNKGRGLYRFLHALLVHLEQVTPDFEVIVVNDGSNDNTHSEFMRYCRDHRVKDNVSRIQYYSYPMNVGKGFALTYGFTKTKGELIVFIDADMDLHPYQIGPYVRELLRRDADIVVGSKRHPGSRVIYPRLRRVYSFVYQIMIRTLFRLSVRDTQVGLKVFRREVLEQVIPRMIVKAFAFDLEMLVVSWHIGFRKIYEAPVDLRHKKFGSTIDLRAVKDIVQDTLAIFYRKNVVHYYDRDMSVTDKVYYDPASPGRPALSRQ